MHTRCPHCSTTFSISQQHLDVAEGQVRCGSCDQVFDGRDNVIDTKGNYVRKKTEEKTSEFETGADIFGMIEKASSEINPELNPDPQPKKQSKNTSKIDESWADALLAEEGIEDAPDTNTPPPVIETMLVNNNKPTSIVSEPVTAPKKNQAPTAPSRKAKPRPPESAANESQLSEEFLDISGQDNLDNPFRDSDASIQQSPKPDESITAITKQKLLNEKQAKPNKPQNVGIKTLDSLNKENNNTSNNSDTTILQAESTTQSASAITKAKEKKSKQEQLENDDELFDQELLAELSDFFENPSEQSLPPEEKQILDKKSGEEESGNSNKIENIPENKDPKETLPSEELNNSSLINELKDIANDLDNKDPIDELPLIADAPVSNPKTSNKTKKEQALQEKAFDKPKSERLFELNFDASELIPDEPLAKPELETNRFFHRAFYSFSILMVSLLLAFQFIYFNMSQFARDPLYRPYYQNACELLSCTLPTLQNLNKIRGSHLVVRQHPDYARTLMVDIIMTNTADYPQLFPIMEVVFTDGEQQPIRQRQLKPKEYLMGNLANLKTMPSGKPIHVSLEIVDPGPKAKGWEINFLTFLN